MQIGMISKLFKRNANSTQCKSQGFSQAFYVLLLYAQCVPCFIWAPLCLLSWNSECVIIKAVFKFIYLFIYRYAQ